VAAFKTAIREADAILIATPEYNYGVPGVLQNAIDWASRPSNNSVLNRKPAGRDDAAVRQKIPRSFFVRRPWR